MNSATVQARFRGCLLGLAVGDAVGTTLEFCAPGSFTPITDMHGGGPFALRAGQWTDDTSMALCLAHSLLYRQGFDAADQMNRYCNWYQHGYLSSTGTCFDIGGTVRQALERYLDGGPAFSGSDDPRSAGNGSLMRLAPVAMFYAQRPEQLGERAADSSRTTHAAPEALDACRLFAFQLRAALLGSGRDEVLRPAALPSQSLVTPAIGALLVRVHASVARAQIRGTGYVVDALSAALWCFATTDTFADAVLRAANLGDDADTTAAICGQLAGAFYGIDGIPAAWRERVQDAAEIVALADRLYEAAQVL
ncbi:ADP-ribosylglycohydrolase family protein [Xanthomonas campestris pv. campestris]|uniref:Dinitrogenase reductase activating glycohydrolase n=1 Tax=Xanthomonas campestris pv. campestris (strain ATCC 33913 / DSM 3586 / NCPPB 528 / LMG 568 / P 25) TaxID=190485 RepID=Q8P6N9_XANCP|nr:ADP-ribosylglycohydrolase family protein [Xanthomonas campestris]AAM42200.1 dinitrogenase reductase activating glycohydrolase [Xanthomonas campestris pv. campestris str. ATCC 33913]MCC5075604.1 ADP-ribosylglycohydrolase family protein [Xanthomonas campestris pv. campestris]MCF8810829.1 ADP-ribosylglycohydrolase family protein [Xanthomonas campestris pv. campestris]MDM7670930.1 ADP-ribosylglycohydrolase family protein [Xanthomonas campestris pv. campestris]MDM7691858.1 ADP-ribosylglycohydrol